MRSGMFFLFALTFSVLTIACTGGQESLPFGRFGTVWLYRHSPRPTHVVLLVSGQEGWNPQMGMIAKALASRGALVAGIDLPRYLDALATAEEWCAYPGGDFEALSKFVQQKFSFPSYELPVLVGYGGGATLVYATLAQAPANLIRGAISLSFCPDLQVKKPLCQWNSLHWQQSAPGKAYTLLPAATLPYSWIVLQGADDTVCHAPIAQAFVARVQHATIVSLPQVGHDFALSTSWMPQLEEAFTTLVQQRETDPAPQAEAVKDLPLIEMPTTGAKNDTLAVILSGDGGWASIDRDLGNTFVDRGLAVVGLNSLRYFWTPRTPEEVAKDLQRMLRYYLKAWQKDDAILIGYSRGADVLPFMARRLPPDLLAKVKLIVLLGPARATEFAFHLTDWFGGSAKTAGHPILPEVEQLKGVKVLCVYGEEESDSLCPHLDTATIRVICLKGGHHFDGDYQALAATILREAGTSEQ